MIHRLRKLFFLLLVIVLSVPAVAQIELFPLPEKYAPTSTHRNARVAATPLALPFFDDFSTSSVNPDTTLWINNGVVINNQNAINPPSKGVATFDGLQFSGRPYQTGTTIAQGATDTLTSQPINLAGLQNANVFLSFYWQTQGLGEQPDPTDSLVLEFKDADTVWQAVKTLKGVALGEFIQEIIAVTGENLFHGSFQFRFRMFGRPTGLYDAWHIDYVYLNQNRNANDTFVRDVAVTHSPGFLLKRYTAMPMSQYRANPAAETVESAATNAYNLFNQGIFSSYRTTITDLISGQTIADFNFPNPVGINSRTRQELRTIFDPATLIPTTADSLRLQLKFTINAGDNNLTIPPVDLRRNDTISTVTALTNYLAYDDGTAEYALGVRQTQGRVATKFVLNEPDTLTAVQLYFTQLENDLRGQTFVLRVWKQLDDQPTSVLYQASLPVTYSDTINKFITFQTTPVILSDTFYVGWQQSTGDILAIGFDKNTDASDQIFYNTGGRWEPYNLSAGSSMVRPVFGFVSTVGIEEDRVEQAFRVSPNPTNGLIGWNNEQVSQVSVFNAIGSRLLTRTFRPADARTLDMSLLPNGLYIVQFTIGKQVLARKVVVSN